MEQCLCSVIKACAGKKSEIIVVDNHSSDGSFDYFKNRFPSVNFIWNDSNVGFAKANNQAMQIASGEYILLLNPDTIVPEDCFDSCISFLRKQTNNAALGVKMIDGSGNFLKESKRAFPSPVTSFFKLAGLAKLFPHSSIFAKYHLGHLDENENHEVDVLAGAFMMIPQKILHQTGGFDEDFFMYGEDIDLSYRIQKAGFKNFFFAETCIIHFKGESTRKGSLNYVKMFYQAMSIFVKKHYGGGRAGIYTFFIHIAIFMRAGVAGFSRLIKPKWKEKNNLALKGQSVLIFGNTVEVENAKKFLIDAGQIFQHDPSTDSDEIRKVVVLNKTQEIIFCEGKLTFKQIIQLFLQTPPSIRKRIFANGSHAVIWQQTNK